MSTILGAIQTLIPVQPYHAPSLIGSIPLPDRVFDPTTGSIPDVYEPVAITGVEPAVNDNRIPPPPVVTQNNPDGSVISRPIDPTVPLNPVLVPPYVPVNPLDPSIPVDPTIPAPVVPTIPDSVALTPAEVLAQARPIIRDAVKDAVAEAQAEANENAVEDAENATPPDTNSFNIMNYLDYGDSWLPAECPNDLVFDIGGQNFVFSYSTVCEYAPSVRTFVLVSSLISFVGIVVGGLKS